MTLALPDTATLSEAWAGALAATAARPGGQAVHLLMTVTQPCAELPEVRRAVDDVLSEIRQQSVETVAGTIFPASLYPIPNNAWEPDLATDEQARIDRAATTLYDRYGAMLPLLRTEKGNSKGTYFQRMISYPGPESGGFNQLQARIAAMRSLRRAGTRTGNYLNIELAQDGQPIERGEPGDVAQAGVGLQLLRPEQGQPRGFPCLVHVDLTMEHDRLHVLAVYRRQNLITKAYGNLLGLSRLQAFLCQQTGLQLGQLAVMATFADAEYNEVRKRRVDALIARAQDLIEPAAS